MSVIESLREVHSKLTSISDQLKEISNNAGSTEMESIIVDLVSSTLSLALDVEDAANTYTDMSNESVEVEDDSEELLEPKI